MVCRINDSFLQKRLLAEPLAKAVELTLNSETVMQSVKELRGKQESGGSTPRPVHKTNIVTPASGQNADFVPTCYHCGNKGHAVSKCRVRSNVVCHNCHKQGHLQRPCKGNGKPRRTKRRSRGVGHVQDEKEEEEEEEEESDPEEQGKPKNLLCHLRSRGVLNSPPIIVKVRVDDDLISKEVDTGAAHSLISEKTIESLWPGSRKNPTTIRLQSYSIPVKGCCYVNVESDWGDATFDSGWLRSHIAWERLAESDPVQLERNSPCTLSFCPCSVPISFQRGSGAGPTQRVPGQISSQMP